MSLLHDPDDHVWRALSNVARRAILDVLREGPRATGELAEVLGLDRHVLMQHLAVLRDAELVHVETRGRLRINHLNPVPIQRIHRRWVSRYEENWLSALIGLKDTVERTLETSQNSENSKNTENTESTQSMRTSEKGDDVDRTG